MTGAFVFCIINISFSEVLGLLIGTPYCYQTVLFLKRSTINKEGALYRILAHVHW
jgi:hypothetical protein